MDQHLPARPLAASARLVSIDALRGAAVTAMLFFNNIVYRDAVPRALAHVRWNGFALPDGVFPLFLFVVGASMAVASHAARSSPSERTRRLIRRAGMLIAIGLMLNLVWYGLPLRYPGILQRIALASLLAAPFVPRRTRWVFVGAAAFLALHTWILLSVAAPGVPAGTLERGRNVAGWIDVVLLGRTHLLGSGFDPEGLLGVLTSTAEVLFGVAAGQVIVRRPELAGRLSVAGVAALLAAGLASPSLPVNKRLFTATFVLLTAGVNSIMLGALFELADRRGYRRFPQLFVPLGRNAIFVYAVAGVISTAIARLPVPMGDTTVSPSEAVASVFAPLIGPALASLVVSVMHVAAWWAVAEAMDRKRWYVRL